jgi:hypothetical protein
VVCVGGRGACRCTAGKQQMQAGCLASPNSTRCILGDGQWCSRARTADVASRGHPEGPSYLAPLRAHSVASMKYGSCMRQPGCNHCPGCTLLCRLAGDIQPQEGLGDTLDRLTVQLFNGEEVTTRWAGLRLGLEARVQSLVPNTWLAVGSRGMRMWAGQRPQLHLLQPSAGHVLPCTATQHMPCHFNCHVASSLSPVALLPRQPAAGGRPAGQPAGRVRQAGHADSGGAAGSCCCPGRRARQAPAPARERREALHQ